MDTHELHSKQTPTEAGGQRPSLTPLAHSCWQGTQWGTPAAGRQPRAEREQDTHDRALTLLTKSHRQKITMDTTGQAPLVRMPSRSNCRKSVCHSVNSDLPKFLHVRAKCVRV